MKKKRSGGIPCPVTIRGVTYPSQAEAARALGVKQTNISKALNLGQSLDNIGLGRNAGRTTEAWIGEIHYDSVTEAARAAGLKPNTVLKRVCTARKAGKTQFTINNGVTLRFEDKRK